MLSILGCLICGLLFRFWATDSRDHGRRDPMALQVVFVVLVVAEVVAASFAAAQSSYAARDFLYLVQAVCFVGAIGAYLALSRPGR